MRDREEAGSRQVSLGILARAIALIEQVAVARAPLGVSELARRTSMPKTSVYRTLEILATQELVTRQANGYILGRRMRRLAQLTHDRVPEDLRQLLVPYLVELYEHTGDVVSLGVLDGDDVLILEVIRGRTHEHLALIGRRVPAHCSAIGKVLLAYRGKLPAVPVGQVTLPRCTPHTIADPAALAAELRHVRRQGLAASHEEQVLGLIELAMPVLAVDGAVAGISRSREAPAHFDDQANAVHREVAIAASTAVRRHGHPDRIPAQRKPALEPADGEDQTGGVHRNPA
jgi:IclR family KDG regulon transcriptional repressor